MENKNILIVGVGGQGTLLASRVLGALAAELSLDCKLSEVHGMSQRGGSVVTHVRIGKEIAAPVLTEGEADYILAFEKLEALRWHHYLKPEGKLLINNQQILPMPVIIGQSKYPTDVLDTLAKRGKAVVVLEAERLAEELGNSKALNVVMLGALMNQMGVPFETAVKAVESAVPARFLELNVGALKLGYQKA